MKEIILCKVTEIDSSNDIYMSLHIRMLTSITNLNRARFTKEFIDEVVDNQEFYRCMPLVCEKNKLENGMYNSLGHAVEKNGEFKTDQIGGFSNFYNTKVDDSYELFGVARVFKRNTKVCTAIMELYEADSLFFSVEVMVEEYKSKTSDERVIDVHPGNKLISDCIVSIPAEPKSKVELLVAEQNIEGGVIVAKNERNETTFFEKAIMLENQELNLNQVRSKVFAKCRDSLKESIYDYFCTEFGYNYLVLENYETADLFKIDYTVNSNDVDISEMYQVVKVYQSIDNQSVDSGTVIVSSNNDINDNDELDKLNLVIESKISEISELKMNITEKEDKISELNSNITELNSKLTNISETLVLKDKELLELNEYKSELDKIKLEISEKEKLSNIEKLKNKYSKLLNSEVMEKEDVVNAINELDIEYLNNLVVESALEKAEMTNSNDKEIITSSITDEIKLNSTSLVDKYITRN